MAVSEAQKRATAKYEKENYDKILVRFPKGTKERILNVTSGSVNNYIIQNILSSLETDEGASVAEIEDIFNTRAFVEEYAATRAAKRVTDQQLVEMEEILQRMERDRDQDLSVFVHLDMEFHGLVMDAAGSPALKRAWKVLRMAEWTYICALITEFSLDELIAQHRNIFRYLQAHEESSAGAYMFLHIKGFGNELAKYFEKRQKQ